MSTRRAVVSYPVNASKEEKTRALLDGIHECVTELVELGHTRLAINELEQVANDAESGDFDG